MGTEPWFWADVAYTLDGAETKAGGFLKKESDGWCLLQAMPGESDRDQHAEHRQRSGGTVDLPVLVGELLLHLGVDGRVAGLAVGRGDDQLVGGRRVRSGRGIRRRESPARRHHADLVARCARCHGIGCFLLRAARNAQIDAISAIAAEARVQRIKTGYLVGVDRDDITTVGGASPGALVAGRAAGGYDSILDAAQTLPAFVYLIPALALFNPTRFTAIVAGIRMNKPA